MTPEELEPLEPVLGEKPKCRRWYIGSLGLGGLVAIACLLLGKDRFLASNVEELTELVSFSLCSATDCVADVDFLGHGSAPSCNGAPNSPECKSTCCTEPISCTSLPGGYCAAVGPGFARRSVSIIESRWNLVEGKCSGKDECEDTCCQGSCADHTCDAGTSCARPFGPEKCTKSTCQEQCCYDKNKYCSIGINAWTAACQECRTQLAYCESKIVPRSSVSREQWNRLALEKVAAGTLEPGCEEIDDAVPRCRDTLKMRVISVFLLHKTKESTSANTVAVLPGGTEAISGGNDGQVWQWRLSDGHPLKNFTADGTPILQVSPFNDATYFCSVSAKQAIVWLLQKRYGMEVSAQTELPTDLRKGYPAPYNTACTGVNTWETAIVGQNNSFAVIWHWKQSGTLMVPVDWRLPFSWEIQYDAKKPKWPWWDKENKLQDAFIAWRKHLFGIDKKYNRRLKVNVTETRKDLSSKDKNDKNPMMKEESDEELETGRRLKRSIGPVPNWFTNFRWGDIPKWYYEPDGWGEVTAVIQIPSNLYFVCGYEFGSIRIWKTYNGFIQAVIPKAHVGRVNALMPAPAGDMFWSGGADGFLRAWEAGSGKHIRSHYAAYAGPATTLAMVPGGNAFWSGHASGDFLFWLVSEEPPYPLCWENAEGGPVNSMYVNPGKIGQVAVALGNGLVKLYEQR